MLTVWTFSYHAMVVHTSTHVIDVKVGPRPTAQLSTVVEQHTMTVVEQHTMAVVEQHTMTVVEQHTMAMVEQHATTVVYSSTCSDNPTRDRLQ